MFFFAFNAFFVFPAFPFPFSLLIIFPFPLPLFFLKKGSSKCRGSQRLGIRFLFFSFIFLKK